MGYQREFCGRNADAHKNYREQPAGLTSGARKHPPFLMNRFPYKLLYAIEDEQVTVIAMAYQLRNIDYWLDRISSS
jgi:hypothetical protein